MINEIAALMEISPNPRVELLSVAHQHDVAVVDDVYMDWKRLAEAVRRLQFERALGAFPGWRATLRTRMPTMDGMIAKMLASEQLLAVQHTVIFSLLAQIAEFEQEHHVPHRDADVQISGVIYLCNSSLEGEGTAFYRHRESGLQGVFLNDPELEMAARSSPFETVDEFLFDLSLPAPGRSIYRATPSQTWENSLNIALRPNRLVLFDSRLFHAVLLPRNQSTRLTQNLFLRALPEQAIVRFRAPT